MVVLGHPLGNGHPLGAIITTEEIAGSFANGMEFFSTFGRATLACAIGSEVLSIVDDEGLQHNAAVMGNGFWTGFAPFRTGFPSSAVRAGAACSSGWSLSPTRLRRPRPRRLPAMSATGFVITVS